MSEFQCLQCGCIRPLNSAQRCGFCAPKPEEAATSRFHELYTLEDGMYVRNEMPKRDEGLQSALSDLQPEEAAGEVSPMPTPEEYEKAAQLKNIGALSKDGLERAYRELSAHFYAALRELQRLTQINTELCKDKSTLLADGARLESELQRVREEFGLEPR